MGAWSTEAYGCDEACDWAHGLERVDDLSRVEAAIAAVAGHPPGDLPDGLGIDALAAAEVLARLRGHDGYRDAYTESVDRWVARVRLAPPPALVRQALAALDRIVGEGSGLRGLWEEDIRPGPWCESVRELQGRLRAEPRPPSPPGTPWTPWTPTRRPGAGARE